MVIDWNLIREKELITLPDALVAVQSARARIKDLEEARDHYTGENRRLYTRNEELAKEVYASNEELAKEIYASNLRVGTLLTRIKQLEDRIERGV